MHNSSTPTPSIETEAVVRISQNDRGILSLQLNRPASANALSPDMVELLLSALNPAEPPALCVITGVGKHFCAGFDLSDIDELSDGDLLLRFLRIETLLQTIHHAAFPIIALAHGQTIGAGADLFAACWQRIAALDCQFRFPGWNFELALGTRRLSRLVGQTQAKDFLIDARAIPAQEAHSSGLATRLLAPKHWADAIEHEGQRCNTLTPFAVQQMLALNVTDTRDADLAAIVHTAGRPGLKARIIAFQQKIAAQRAARRQSVKT